jgi:hypothetical protein
MNPFYIFHFKMMCLLMLTGHDYIKLTPPDRVNKK